MSSGKIDDSIGRTIRAANRRGESNVAIVSIVEDRHGVRLNRRSIDRWLADNPTPPPKKRSRSDAIAPETAPEALDEEAILEERVRRMRERLAADLVGTKNEPKWNAELRQTLAQLRAVRAAAALAAERAKAGSSSEAADLREQLIRGFAPRRPSEDAAPPDRPPLPDVEVAPGHPRTGS